MAIQYPENPMYKSLVETAYKVNVPRLNKKAVDVSRFGNVAKQTSGFAKAKSTITTPYGGSTKFESYHPGIDVAAAEGTKIPTVLGGTVKEVVGGKVKGSPNYGNYVIVEDEFGGKHRYSHLHQSYVKVGEKLAPGQVLGTMGRTGQTYSVTGGTGTHLDYRIVDAYGKYVNPIAYLSKYKNLKK